MLIETPGRAATRLHPTEEGKGTRDETPLDKTEGHVFCFHDRLWRKKKTKTGPQPVAFHVGRNRNQISHAQNNRTSGGRANDITARERAHTKRAPRRGSLDAALPTVSAPRRRANPSGVRDRRNSKTKIFPTHTFRYK